MPARPLSQIKQPGMERVVSQGEGDLKPAPGPESQPQVKEEPVVTQIPRKDMTREIQPPITIPEPRSKVKLEPETLPPQASTQIDKSKAPDEKDLEEIEAGGKTGTLDEAKDFAAQVYDSTEQLS